MANWYTQDVETLFEAILTLKSVEECRLFFEDACTVKEIREISQRLQVARMLRNGSSYASINGETGVSTATISRVSRCLRYGSGGYKKAIDKLKAEEKA